MKFTISKESFQQAIQQVQHVVSARTTLAILSNVLLRAREGVLELTTTDLDVGVTCSVPAEVEEEGATTLPARRLATIIRELPGMLEEAISAAQTIAGYSLPVTMIAKEAVNRAFETTLAEGVLFERRTFHATFALADKREGMSAFVEKRQPHFSHR